MSTNARYELQAGIFMIATLVLFIASIFILGSERQIFASQYEYYTKFGDIKGLNVGAPVRLGGIAVGRVSDIRFGKESNDLNVYVTLLVNERFKDRLRTDTTAAIDTQGLLGDRFISLSSGAANAEVPPGGTIPAREAPDFAAAINQAGSAIDHTSQIADRVNKIVSKLEGEPIDDLSKSLASISSLLGEIEKGKGLMNRLVYSKQDGERIVGSLESASADLKSIMAEVKDGKGLLHALIYDPQGSETLQSLGEASKGLAKASTEIASIAAEVRSGKGLINNLIYKESPAGIGDLVASLNRTATNLETASQSLAEGSGTLGALLIDSKLYDNIVEVTDDAKRSYILRHAIRKSLGDKKEKDKEALDSDPKKDQASQQAGAK